MMVVRGIENACIAGNFAATVYLRMAVRRKGFAARRRARAAALAMLALLGGRAGADPAAEIMEGLRPPSEPESMGVVCLSSPQITPVLLGESRGTLEPVMAAGSYGRGRVTVIASADFIESHLSHSSTGPSMLGNLVQFVSAHNAKPKIGVIGSEEFARRLGRRGYEAQETTVVAINKFDVLFVSGASRINDEGCERLRDYVFRGGGLILGDSIQNWRSYLQTSAAVTNHPANRILGPMGVALAEGYARPPERGYVPYSESVHRLTHSLQAFAWLLRVDKGEIPATDADRDQALAALSRAASSLPASDTFLMIKLRQLFETRGRNAVPTSRAPLGQEKLVERLLVRMQTRLMNDMPAERTTAHPASDTFPGPVAKTAIRTTVSTEVKTTLAGWHSTGAYAAPGDALTIRLPRDAAALGLILRIGSHPDRLWNLDEWKRMPEITRSIPLDQEVVRAANAMGGLVYVEVPSGCEDRRVPVRIEGCVEAPYYLHGVTSVADWRSRIRRHPAPWAELAGSRVILTVPSTLVRDLEDPAAVMDWWDRLLGGYAELAGLPKEFKRPERIIPDIQLAGSPFHGGYPWMTLGDMMDTLPNLSKLAAAPWNLLASIARQYQSDRWASDRGRSTFAGIFAAYAEEAICAVSTGNPELAPEARAKRVEQHFAAGRQWTDDPYRAIVMFLQIRDGFGWTPFQKAFAEFRALTDEQLPQDDQARLDLWLTFLSRATKRNLGPFFRAWNIPTTESARIGVASLPPWFPEGFPPGVTPTSDAAADAPATRAATPAPAASTASRPPPFASATASAASPSSSVRVALDTSAAPDLAEWGARAKADLERLYPQLAALLRATNDAPPAAITLVLDPAAKGIASTAGTTIRVSAAWVREHPHDRGVTIHEAARIAQGYPKYDPPWLVEGIADYCRYWLYEPAERRPRVDPMRHGWTEGYTITASFLGWLEEGRATGIVRRLSRALRAGKYSDRLFQEITGKDLPSLWREFAESKAPAVK